MTIKLVNAGKINWGRIQTTTLKEQIKLSEAPVSSKKHMILGESPHSTSIGSYHLRYTVVCGMYLLSENLLHNTMNTGYL